MECYKMLRLGTSDNGYTGYGYCGPSLASVYQ